MTLLIHAGNIQGISDINYDLDKNNQTKKIMMKI